MITGSVSNLSPLPPDTIFTPLKDGWYRGESRLINSQGQQLLPRFEETKINPSDLNFIVQFGALSASYTFKDFTLEYNQPMTEVGVNAYHQIDNTNNRKYKAFRTVKRSLLQPIKNYASFAATRFFDWQTIGAPYRRYAGSSDLYQISTAFDDTVYVTYCYFQALFNKHGGPLYRFRDSDGFVRINDTPNSTNYFNDDYLRYSSIAVKPNDSKILFAYSHVRPAGLYKSVDGGSTWQLVFSGGDQDESIGKVSADQNGTVIFQDVLSTDCYISTKNGASGTFSASANIGTGTHINNFSNAWYTQRVSGSYRRVARATYNAAKVLSSFSDVPLSSSTLGFVSMSVYGGSQYNSVVTSYENSSNVYGLATGTGSQLYVMFMTGSMSYFDFRLAPTLSGSYSFSDYNITVDRSGKVYVGFIAKSTDLTKSFPVVCISKDYGATFLDADKIILTSSQTPPAQYFRFSFARQNNVYFGIDYGIPVNSFGIVNMYRGREQTNANNLSISYLRPSYTYVESEVGLETTRKSVLHNVAEFSHIGGQQQSPRIVLGTRDRGTFGPSDSSIVQIKYIGSLVQILWPEQNGQPVSSITGLDSLQFAGSVGTGFSNGTSIDVTNYDSLSLYCYAQKQTSGTLDAIQIQVQRKPIKSVAFANDQAVNYVASGSQATEATYTDIIHTKNIDYGDLSLKQISYVIDLSLKNVKEVRIAAKQKYGQDETNRSFVVWGRLINSKVET